MTELEVTGISRSGRVRKKSSKLTDFESLDEIDIRSNSRIKKEKLEQTPTSTVSRPIKKERIVKEEILSDVEDSDLQEGSYPVKQDHYSEESDNDGYPPNEDSSMDSLGSELEEGDDVEMERDDGNGFQPITGDDSSDEASSRQRGLFGSNKSNKKKLIIKEGKILGKVKTPKKDKGTSRLTAYMLWAKEIRQKLMRSNPEMDFSQMSKKLGELWGRVPFHEKDVWKRRANRASVVKKPPGNTNQTRPAILTQTSTVQEQQSNANQTRKVKTSPTRKFLSKPAQPQQHLQQALTPSSQVISTSAASSTVSSDSKAQSKNSFSADSSVFKPVSTSAMDVAAHLKLLGESLTIIGERLTEHEGQIAVSGSFSVLLDSLLCALGPLLCLTQQVPQMNVVPQEQLSQIMDNIAYIMPGL
ncbi:uncharacterized protein isoform X2 [Rhodnius prolixus]|uniref:uncharacterized protein isoform X2 n=1 Tax=Rhodnius prolixus TaxID=13249 RepID=UPI003D18EC00